MLGRLAHPFGMDRPAPNPLRVGGMVATWMPMLGLAVYALTLTYDRGRSGPEIELSPVRTSGLEP